MALCKACKTATANRKGTLCHPCWKKAEEAAGREAKLPPPPKVKVPRLLKDMRWVYDNPDKVTDSPSLTRLQEFYDRYPERFVARLERLESNFLLQKKDRKDQVKDPGTQAALGLIDRVLKQALEDSGRD